MTVVATLLAATTACAQWTFTLDQGFRTQIQEKNVNSIALMDDGGILLSGRIRFPGDVSDRGSAKLLSTGQRDLSFPGFPQTTGAGKLVPWSGKFYVVNSTIRRLDGSGLIDPSFIMMNSGPYFSSHISGDYHVYPDGRILMSGKHLLSDSIRGFEGHYNMIWFSNEGYLDTTRTHRMGNGTVNRLHELPNGQFICSSTCTEFEGQPVDWIFRTHADGAPDTTFRTGVYIGSAFSFLPLPDGRVYVGGNYRRTVAPEDTLRLVRFMPDGSLDPTFSVPHFNDGLLDWPFGASVTNIQPWGSGMILVTGQFRYVNGQSRNGICLIDSTGQLLDTFSGQGVGIYETQFLDYATVDHAIYDSDNSYLYICGAYVGYNDGMANDSQQRFVSRLLVSELTTEVDETAGQSIRVYPNPAHDQVTLEFGVVSHPEHCYLRLLDPAGRELQVHALHGSEGRLVLDIKDLAPGLYSVEVRVGGRLALVQKLVVE